MQCFFVAMSMFPEAQLRAQEEIDHQIGQRLLPTMSDRVKLPYIEVLLQETLRWHLISPIPHAHVSEEDDLYREALWCWQTFGKCIEARAQSAKCSLQSFCIQFHITAHCGETRNLRTNRMYTVTLWLSSRSDICLVMGASQSLTRANLRLVLDAVFTLDVSWLSRVYYWFGL
ncbi:hypothetical protein F5884DRAFT_835717 [Xylogone sp. PMI_703]|nr:hypothetical protein F5884DRAFT_835717 [Xylogone sp. PMI_703]